MIGIAEEGRVFPAEMARQRRRRPEPVFHQRFADHPRHRDRRQHQRQQEDDAEEFARPDLRVEQQRQAEGDDIFDQHGEHVEHHVEQRVAVVGIAQHLPEIVEPVELAAGEGTEVPVGQRDVEAEQRREDHHGDGEQQRRQQEQRALAVLAARQHLADAERHAPQHIGIDDRPPGLEADSVDVGLVEDLQRDHGQQAERRNGHQRPAEPLAARRDQIGWTGVCRPRVRGRSLVSHASRPFTEGSATGLSRSVWSGGLAPPDHGSRYDQPTCRARPCRA